MTWGLLLGSVLFRVSPKLVFQQKINGALPVSDAWRSSVKIRINT
jgi:hypothetical protein